jgi:hypothetical protein
LIFPASYSGTNLVSLSLPCWLYSLRPTIAALCADSSSTNPCAPFRLSMYSLLTFVFCWWIPSMLESCACFDLSYQFLFLTIIITITAAFSVHGIF